MISLTFKAVGSSHDGAGLQSPCLFAGRLAASSGELKSGCVHICAAAKMAAEGLFLSSVFLIASPYSLCILFKMSLSIERPKALC